MRVTPIAAILIGSFPFAVADAATHKRVHASSPPAPALTLESINAAAPQGTSSERALILKTEVLLDRDGFSPGEIDGKKRRGLSQGACGFPTSQESRGIGKTRRGHLERAPFGQHRSAAHIVHDLAERRGWPI
jgi:hypothetical protein